MKPREEVLEHERDLLRAKVYGLLGLLIRPGPGGGFVVSLPRDPDGYPAGEEIEPGKWHFRRRKDAMDATLYAAERLRDE